MHVRLRIFGKPDTIVVVESKLTKIDQFRKIVKEKFGVEPKLQRLLYGGKLLENGCTFHDYNIKLNDVIQLIVKFQPDESTNGVKQEDNNPKKNDGSNQKELNDINYKDAESALYAIGDLVDTRDREQGAWLEGKIVRIVLDPDSASIDSSSIDDTKINLENKPPEDATSPEIKPKKKGIAKYFSKSPKSVKKKMLDKESSNGSLKIDHVLYKVQLDNNEHDSILYCKPKDIRPRARRVIDVTDLNVGQVVMVNHNTEEPSEKGYWYDFKVDEIKKLRSTYDLVGTLYLGADAVPQNDTRIKVHDKIFAIEEVVPIAQRTEDYKKLMTTQPDKRALPLNCSTCRDDEDAPCKDCGCYLCCGKEFPEKIVLCDECNNGFHMGCLDPPLQELPEEDWYCPSCKRDTNYIIAPGAAKQVKKASASKSSRDWGRGMACVGKTKTCAMPPNHFGPIPGIEVGMCWRFRIQLSETGVHRPPVSGIHGRDVEGAYSIVLSGGYEDDVDHGNDFTYTGSGGRDLSGNKRTAEQSCDQTLTRENKALARNCAVALNEEGGDAGENWRAGRPVRVVRSYKMLKHFPEYAPAEGVRYDGIYKVVKYYPEKGLSGYRVWKYLLRRDDPAPAPWEPGVTKYPIIYPDGYLEAEAEKKALKEKAGKTGKGKKRALRENNQSSESGDDSPVGKRRKTNTAPKKKGRPPKNKSTMESPNAKIASIFTVKSPKSQVQQPPKGDTGLSSEEKAAIDADTLNAELWQECVDICNTKGKKEFVEHVTQVFICIICQDLAVDPVTTPCLHNFCMACLRLAFKSTGVQSCPCCRRALPELDMSPNEQLRQALRTVMAGYDAGKK